MNNQRVALRLPRMTAPSREHLIDAFWVFSVQNHKLKESERLHQINTGRPAELALATKATFNLADEHLELLFNASLTTLKRLQHQHKLLSYVASERLDRIAFMCQQAVVVFESREGVTRWMSAPNASFGHSTPLLLCMTDIGGHQVSRVLHALEWGGTV